MASAFACGDGTFNVTDTGACTALSFTGNVTGSATQLAAAGRFISAETTGTGSAQNVAHGLGVTPTVVLVAPTEYSGTGAFDVAEGTHTSTNVVLTVTSGLKFKVLALV